MKAKDFDKKFEEGQEDMVDDLDLPSARRVNQEQKRINVDFLAWVVESPDRYRSTLENCRKLNVINWPLKCGHLDNWVENRRV